MILPPNRKVCVPGKLMLLGEYAVLTGAPAMVSSVDRYAVIQWSQRPKRASPIIRAVAHEYEATKQQEYLVADTKSFYQQSGQKLGIGSSAAVAVGASVFLRQAVDDIALRKALDSHRAASDGIGSGVDLASVFHGGVIATTQQPAKVETLFPFFEDLHLAIFFLAKSASTKAMVAKCQRSDDWTSLTQSMSELSQRGIRAYQKRQTSEFMNIVGEYGRHMRALGTAANVPIYTPQMELLDKCASSYGAVSKPSGAGGGDVALVFSHDPEIFHAIANETGLEKLSMSLETKGTHFLDD